MPAPADQPVRDRIEREFDKTFLVEAGAGSGKTECLARRMAAGIAAGAYAVDGMAAVTFTRKAAAELRGRFQRALETRISDERHPPSPEERGRLEGALAHLERLFSGTIHAFCASMLRERPVEAGRAPDFSEIDDLEDVSLREQAWREFWAHERASGSAVLRELQQAGVRASHLDAAFARMCDHGDVEFPATRVEPPAVAPVIAATAHLLAALDRELGPSGVQPGTTCKLQQRLVDFRRSWDSIRVIRIARVAEALGKWDRADSGLGVVQKRWAGDALEARGLAFRFRDEVVRPFLRQWREYVYGVAVTTLSKAREFYAAQRRRRNVVNYVDLLCEAARLLRDHPDVRTDLQRKHRWIFVDEFQDTDPLQAEILLWLASEGGEGDVWTRPLRPGALFIVGDPKQSIYRFRRADIEIYNRVRRRVQDCGERGDVLSLTANFRSHRAVCEFVNGLSAAQFPKEPDEHDPRFEPLRPAEQKVATGPCGARVLTVPRGLGKGDATHYEADAIARIVAAAHREGAPYHDFLVLTHKKEALPVFAEAFDRYDVPVEVSGAGRFGSAPDVFVLGVLLRALADPLDQAALVGVLRGPLFGISDPDLYAYRKAGGAFDLSHPLEEEESPALADALDAHLGPVRPAMRALRRLTRATRQLPLPVALDHIVDDTGWLALGASSAAGAGAGRILQAIDCARLVLERGGGLAEAADALESDKDSSDAESWPLEPGRADVVRLMNLHKAKGLEARVVFLADATRGLGEWVDVHIERTSGPARGYFAITTKNGWQAKPVAEPAGWDAHQAAEMKHVAAERKRLAYVAATRAGELLVVSRVAPESAKEDKEAAWRRLLPFLGEAAELAVPDYSPPAAAPAGVAATDAASALTARAEAMAVLVEPSWAASLVTTEVKKIAWAPADGEADALATRAPASAPERPTSFATRDGVASSQHEVLGDRRLEAEGDQDPAEGRRLKAEGDQDRAEGRRLKAEGYSSSDAVTVLGSGPNAALEAIVPDTPSHRAERNAAWGVLVHGLLEHAMRDDGNAVTAEDLRRLGLWLTLDHPELRPHLEAAVEIALAVTRATFWREAREATDRHVEVPFAIRLNPGEPGPDGQPVDRPTVLHGVIDLVHASGRGWQVRDYKTGAMPVDEMSRRYGPQLEIYRAAWTTLVGDR